MAMSNDPKNGCRSCRQDFASISLFDAHRAGNHDFTYSEGVKMEPMREDGRRCLDADEMRAKGWTLDARGRWCNPKESARVSSYFAAKAAA
jgi:hypothetical protein